MNPIKIEPAYLGAIINIDQRADRGLRGQLFGLLKTVK